MALLGAHDAFAQQMAGSYSGVAEASAAAMLDKEHFVVAEDECNTLLVYKFGQQVPVGKPVNLAQFLGTDDKASDIEGGARVGDVIYWLSSHSLPKSRKTREWRHRFFATQVELGSSPPTVRHVGKPYTGMIQAMLDTPHFTDLKLGDAAKRTPEKPGGLNIEGLAAWGDSGVLMGFRNPLHQDKALLIPMQNPGAVVEGIPPKFGAPILLDLGKRGIRSIDRVGNQYLIVASPIADKGTFALYRWSGKESDKPALLPSVLPKDHAFEGLVAVPGSSDILLLSDDGTDDNIMCGSPAKASQTFRAVRVKVP